MTTAEIERFTVRSECLFLIKYENFKGLHLYKEILASKGEEKYEVLLS